MPPDRHDSTTGPSRIRQRNQRACAPCRKRKVKCDGAVPCGTCVGYDYECSYIEKAPRKSRPGELPEPVSATDLASVNATAVTIPIALPNSRLDTRQPYMAQETSALGSGENDPLLQSVKTRVTSAYSAIAWPRRLGTSLALPYPPRLQSFGWNPGIRKEQNHIPQSNICQIIELTEMKQFADIYFKVVHPYFEILDQDMFATRSAGFWISGHKGTDFEACICGVVALGSYFSSDGPSSVESQVVEQGRLLLDLSTSYAPALLSVKHVVAWVLRALYLRLTTRPHLSWMASCTAVHIAEALGLHREISELRLPRNVGNGEVQIRRRIYWVASALNHFFSAEYGRSRVVLELVSCLPLIAREHDLTYDLVTLMAFAPSQNYLGNSSHIIEFLDKAMAFPSRSPFLALIKADVCFCIYRMLCSTDSRLSAEQIPVLLDVIRVALDGNKFLRSLNIPWWNMVSTPFHSVCVLLSVGTSESLHMVPLALDVLKSITTFYDSPLSREAFQTVVSLVRGARDRKSAQLDSLDRGLRLAGHPKSPIPSGHIPAVDEGEQQNVEDIYFPDFLDLTNYYNIDEAFQSES